MKIYFFHLPFPHQKPMNFFKPKDPPATTAAPPSPPQQHPLHQAFTSLQTHFSDFFHNLQANPSPKTSSFARISNEKPPSFNKLKPAAKKSALSAQDIEERLAGVPVYALSNGSQEFVLLSGATTGKSLGLFCFSEADADTLLEQMKSVDPSMSSGSQVVAVALSKVFQLKVDGVALRLMPESTQIVNALKEKKTAGYSDKSFPGVPVFQSKSLILRSENKRYRPAFFRKEDLEKSLSRASRDQKLLNPALRQGDIEVAVLEDVIQGMKDTSVTSWDDVVFIPPGFDVSTDPYQQKL